jgi:hypothetical protein
LTNTAQIPSDAHRIAGGTRHAQLLGEPIDLFLTVRSLTCVRIGERPAQTFELVLTIAFLASAFAFTFTFAAFAFLRRGPVLRCSGLLRRMVV